MNKLCKVCNTEKPAAEFHKNGARNDGLDWRCKPCKRAKENKLSRKRIDERNYQKNKEKLITRDKTRRFYADQSFNCAVLGCDDLGKELHHVDYSDHIGVIPLCKKHHRMNHETCKR